MQAWMGSLFFAIPSWAVSMVVHTVEGSVVVLDELPRIELIAPSVNSALKLVAPPGQYRRMIVEGLVRRMPP